MVFNIKNNYKEAKDTPKVRDASKRMEVKSSFYSSQDNPDPPSCLAGQKQLITSFSLFVAPSLCLSEPVPSLCLSEPRSNFRSTLSLSKSLLWAATIHLPSFNACHHTVRSKIDFCTANLTMLINVVS